MSADPAEGQATMAAESRTVLITGAGGDLGRAFSAVFARAGYAVAGIDNSDAALGRFSAAVETAGGRALTLKCDLGSWSEIETAVEAMAVAFGRIDLVINNATARTMPTFKPLEDCTEDEAASLFAVGPKAALGVMRAALPYLKATRGRVINIGSGAGLNPLQGLGLYSSSKAGLHALTCAAAREWGPFGITVNGILPFVMTEQLEASIAANPETFKAIAPPLGRIGDAQTDVGAVALFLASEAGSYVSGQNIAVSGALNVR